MPSRDVNALARHLGAEPDHASFLIECAAAAHLIAPDSTTALLPTPAYDQWLGQDAPSRWRLVTEAWLDEDRFFARSADAGGHTLGQEAYARGAAGLRNDRRRDPGGREAGDDTRSRPAGHGCFLASTQADPRARNGRGSWCGGHGAKASWLGLAALGAVSSFVRFPLQPDLAMPSALQDLFPAPVKHFIIQTDLTAVTSGPLEHAVAAELRLLADQESRGGAGCLSIQPRYVASRLRPGMVGCGGAILAGAALHHRTYRRRSVTSLRTSPGATPVSESAPAAVTSASLTRRKPRRCWLILMRHDLGCERSLHMFSSPPSMSMSCSRYSKSWDIAPAVENAAGDVIGDAAHTTRGEAPGGVEACSFRCPGGRCLAGRRGQPTGCDAESEPVRQLQTSVCQSVPRDRGQVHRMSGCMPSRSGD